MRRIGIILTLIVLVSILTACMGGTSGRAKDAPPLAAVPSVDINRYAGVWYEIARYPNRFQRNCEGVTAAYTPLRDGEVQVINTCRFGTKDGNPRIATTTARVMDGSNGARLFVNFAPIPLLAGRGNYWVLYLDTDYRHALIGEPSGKYLWMLARTPHIEPAARADLNAAADRLGYDLTRLKETAQK